MGPHDVARPNARINLNLLWGPWAPSVLMLIHPKNPLLEEDIYKHNENRRLFLYALRIPLSIYAGAGNYGYYVAFATG